MDGFARWVLSPIQPQTDRVTYVRQQAALVVHLWDLDHVRYRVELLITELATNATRHARTPYSVGLSLTGSELRGEVTDANPLPPHVDEEATADATGGRGLRLVNEVADAWGYDRHYYGKTVWFVLNLAPSEHSNT
jgi:anti-sigma regulatory factor (Ser/Thr protein kinase)